ncbi:trypsin-7 [Calliopsis andreniformis]|uniref:trypsin-7 n=1 Tax=Calliopsis andreniformis TaxID=337506 RepID=UPI003FCE21BF
MITHAGDYRGRIGPESARSPGSPESRIIGGEKAAIEKYPFVVSLQNNGTFFGHDVEHFCGGGIVGEKWIITSAQCALSIRSKGFHVRAGTPHYHENGDIYEVQSVAIHPAFNKFNYDFDAGLVQLSRSIKFDKTKQPIKLPNVHSKVRDGSKVRVFGWGASKLLGPVSEELLCSTMQKINNEECQRVSEGDILTPRMFCALSDTTSACVGDSGSPLVSNDTLFGVASWSRSCAFKYPTAYTAIAEVKDWITEVTGIA